MAQVVVNATNPKRKRRYQSIKEFIAAWLVAVGQDQGR